MKIGWNADTVAIASISPQNGKDNSFLFKKMLRKIDPRNKGDDLIALKSTVFQYLDLFRQAKFVFNLSYLVNSCFNISPVFGSKIFSQPFQE